MILGFGLRPWLFDSFQTLFLSSVIAGIGLAWILVALAPQMMKWFPKGSASLPVGIASSGLFVGFGSGALSMPFLVEMISMRNAFLVFSIIAFISFFLWVGLARESPPTPPEERKDLFLCIHPFHLPWRGRRHHRWEFSLRMRGWGFPRSIRRQEIWFKENFFTGCDPLTRVLDRNLFSLRP